MDKKNKKNLRIGIVLHSYPGVSESFFFEKLRCLQELQFKVLLFIDDGKKSQKFNSVIGFSWAGGIKNKIIELFKSCFRLVKNPLKSIYLYKYNYDSGYHFRENIVSLIRSSHILSYKLDWLHFGFATNAIGRENLATTIGSKMSASIRGYDIAIYPKTNIRCYDLLWERLDQLHYISDDLLSIAKSEGFNNGRKFKIPPSIDIKKFYGQVRKTISKPLKIVTNARIHWKKGYDYLFQALSILKIKNIPFEYTIIGYGEDYERLVYAAHQMNIFTQIKFEKELSSHEIVNVLSKNDIFILYSIQEGFSNAVLEAQAMGLLCIVSDAEGLNENVINGKTGWVIPKLEPELLAMTIIKVAKSSDNKIKEISSNAIEHVRCDHNLSILKDGYEKFFYV